MFLFISELSSEEEALEDHQMVLPPELPRDNAILSVENLPPLSVTVCNIP
jgi:hypothetical protein